MISNLVGDGKSGFIGTIIGATREITKLQLDDNALKSIDAFSRVSNAVISIVKAITPSPDLIKSMNTSAQASALFGTITTKAEAFNSEGLAQLGSYFQNIMTGIAPLLKVLTGDALQAVISASSGLKPEQFSKIKVVTDVLSSVGSFVGSLSGAATKGLVTETKIDKGVATSIKTQFPTIVDIFGALRDNLGSVIATVIDLAQGLNVKTIGPQLDAVKKSIDVVGSMTTIIKNLEGGEAGSVDVNKIVANVAAISMAVNRLFFGGGAFGTSTSPMTELIGYMNTIASDKDQYAVTGDAGELIKASASKINMLIGALPSLEDSVSKIQGLTLGDKLAQLGDVENIKNKLGVGHLSAFMQGMSEFGVDLKQINKAVADNAIIPSIKAVSEVVAAVNDLNKILASGDATKISVSTNLKKFVTSAGLGSKGTFTIQNQGVQVNLNLQVNMKASEVEDVIILRKKSVIREQFENSPVTTKTLPEPKYFGD